MESGSTQRTIERGLRGNGNHVDDEDESQMPPELDDEDGSSGSEYDELTSEKNPRHNSDSDGEPHSHGRSGRKRRATRAFTDEDKTIVAQAVLDVEEADDPDGMALVWKTLAELVCAFSRYFVL